MIRHISKKYRAVILLPFVMLNCSTTVQQTNDFKLERSIPMPSVKGRIDHMDVQRSQQGPASTRLLN
jgi:hypothetical protein